MSCAIKDRPGLQMYLYSLSEPESNRTEHRRTSFIDYNAYKNLS